MSAVRSAPWYRAARFALLTFFPRVHGVHVCYQARVRHAVRVGPPLGTPFLCAAQVMVVLRLGCWCVPRCRILSAPQRHYRHGVTRCALQALVLSCLVQHIMSCPMRRIPGGMALLATLPHVHCPAPVIALRAALASSAPMRALRGRPCGVRVAAAATTAFALNAPAGYARRGCRKFSPAWVAWVHVPVPLVMALRQALALPRIIAVLTVAASVCGQALGARLGKL